MGLGAIFGFAKNQVKKALPGIAADPKKPATPIVLAPPPSSLAAPAPPDAGLAASSAIGAGMLAAKKVRRKAMSGTGIVKPSSIATASQATPKSLIGY